MSRPQALWNAVLAALLVAVALSGIFWLDSPAGTIAANVALGLLIGTLLGLTGRGRAFALLIIVHRHYSAWSYATRSRTAENSDEVNAEVVYR